MPDYQITEFCRRMVKEHIQSGDCCIDATAGNGKDTEFLCGQVGENGKVYAFDIQKEALEKTAERLEMSGLSQRCERILDGHEKMKNYVREQVSAVMFNFGYLPGGDHKIATKPETSVRAVQEGLALLKKGGIMSLCIYSGGDTGYEEKEILLQYLKELDPQEFLVIMGWYYNRQNDPPLPVFVIRMKNAAENRRGRDRKK